MSTQKERSKAGTKTEKLGPAAKIRPSLPVPADAFRQVGNYLALSKLVGAIDMPPFDSAMNALIDVTDGELQAELAQLKLTIKRSFVDAG